MVLTSLVFTAWLMGVAGLPHCAVMCAAPCAAARPQGLSWASVVGRTLGYALLGALAAGATAGLVAWSAWAAKLQPLWVMGLAASVMLGGWMLAQGRLPPFFAHMGSKIHVQLNLSKSNQSVPFGLSMASGMAWSALPCGLLYSALVVAALAPDPLQGAVVMAAFSLPGGAMLKFLPTFWRQGFQITQRSPWLMRWVSQASAIRLSGAMLAMAAAWALFHRFEAQWQAWCA